MPFFPCAHAGHPVWQHAAKQVVVQLQAQISMQATQMHTGLGVVYVSALYAEHAQEIAATLAQAFPQVQHWVGSVVQAVLGGDLDYGGTGALAVMLQDLETPAYEVFSSLAPWRKAIPTPRMALIHGDASTPQLAQALQQWRSHMAGTELVGGVSSVQPSHAQWVWGAQTAEHLPASIGGHGLQVGGFSGVAWGPQVDVWSVSMQASKPIGHTYTITQTEADVVLELDGKPALEQVLRSVNWDSLATPYPDTETILQLASRRPVLVALPGQQLQGARVMRVVGVDWLRQAIVLDGWPQEGGRLALCQQDEAVWRTEIRRGCAEVWEALTAPASVAQALPQEGSTTPAGRSICGAIYIRNQHRCAAAQAPQVDAELQLIRHALGPIPLLGFSSWCEVEAGELQHLSAQLLVFAQPLQAMT